MLLNRPRAEKFMQEQELDALVATSAPNVMYCSGYECVPHWVNTGVQIFAVLTPGSTPVASLIAPMFALETVAESDVWIEDIYASGAYWRGTPVMGGSDATETTIRDLLKSATAMPSAIEALVHAIEKRGLVRGRIGLDERGITVPDFEQIRRRLPNATFVMASDIWWDIRAVKTEPEIARLRAAAACAEKSMKAALERVRPGVSERDIVDAYLSQLSVRGGKPTMAFFSSGPRTSHPICNTSDRIMQDGDVVRYDIGCTVGYYHADTARAYVIGRPTDTHWRIWDALVRGTEDAIDMIRPGVHPDELFEAAMKPGRQLGLENFNRTNVGHGLGITMPDRPSLSPSPATGRVTGPVEENMIFTVEVGYHVPGAFGFLCEDIVQVTAKGCQRLTAASRELISL